MPTENRSSNTEMIIVPRGLIEQLEQFGEGSTPGRTVRKDALEQLYAYCTQPAPQPHPDPIAWMVGTAFWWTKEEAERDAAETGLPIVPVGPLSGGVEAEQLREVIKHSDAQIMRQSMRISNQRDQLAERDAHPLRALGPEAYSTLVGMVEFCLNRRVCMGMDEGFKSFEPEEEHGFVKELRSFVALSASAEPQVKS